MSPVTGTNSIDGLQIHEDMAYQRREWRVQRIGWAVMGLLLLAALAGLLGPGPLSDAAAGRAGGPLRVEYSRFERMQSPGELRIHVAARLARTGTVRLRLNRGFVEKIDLVRLYPEPVSTDVDGNGFTYEVGTSGAAAPITAVVQYKYRAFGRMPVQVAVEDGAAVSFEQWVYP
jgi:hypothetical protein